MIACLRCLANKTRALVTISTRASLKRYHNYTLTLGLGEDASGYEMLRIGTQSEKDSVEKELLELRERLANVDGLKRRRDEIDAELNKVWVKKPGPPNEVSLAAPGNGSPTG
jgi:ATP-binding cassette, subfamily D (ALD), peroxisomal long-chain fatty acid import protein